MYRNRKEHLLETHGPGVAGAYETWVDMRRRIRHPLRTKRNGRGYVGLSVDRSWDRFEAFLADMGQRPHGMTIDRVDPSRGYAPANCRWADAVTQARNRPYCKLTMVDAESIRNRYSMGGVSQQTIADAYGCSQVLVSKVIRNVNWAQ